MRAALTLAGIRTRSGPSIAFPGTDPDEKWHNLDLTRLSLGIQGMPSPNQIIKADRNATPPSAPNAAQRATDNADVLAEQREAHTHAEQTQNKKNEQK